MTKFLLKEQFLSVLTFLIIFFYACTTVSAYASDSPPPQSFCGPRNPQNWLVNNKIIFLSFFSS